MSDNAKFFQVHKLTPEALDVARLLAIQFVDLADYVDAHALHGRELALCKTHLEAASFYAKKAMAQKPENQAP